MKKTALRNTNSTLGVVTSLAVLWLSLCSTAMATDIRTKRLDNRVYSCDHVFKPGDNMAVILIMGDAGIAVEKDLEPAQGLPPIFNLNPINGLCYPAVDPMMGTLGSLGSPWIRLANLLLKNNLYDKVLLSPVMLSQSTIEEWQQDGRIFPRAANAVSSLRKLDIPITYIIWQHGQNNEPAMNDPERYLNGFNNLLSGLRELQAEAPVYVARTGNCPGTPGGAVRTAQDLLHRSLENVLPGPDVNALDPSQINREACKLTPAGLDSYANRWFDLFKAEKSAAQELTP